MEHREPLFETLIGKSSSGCRAASAEKRASTNQIAEVVPNLRIGKIVDANVCEQAWAKVIPGDKLRRGLKADKEAWLKA